MPLEPRNREIRVFLSSTFRDMEAERTYLMKEVFPKVRVACHARRVGFTEIDLRWGVTEEESKNGATVEVCLQEIDRCRDFPPFFIGFLGERYGWIPTADKLAVYWDNHPDSPYAEPIRQAVERGISVTELEMELGVLAEGASEKIAGHALFFLRDRALTDRLYQQDKGQAPDLADADYYDPGGGKLEALKARIRRSPFIGVDDYSSLGQFGQAIEAYLLTQLDHYFPADAVPSALQRMHEAHAAFRFHRLQNFLPRADVRQRLLAAMERRVATPALGPILLAGPSGQGKSALLADLARHLEAGGAGEAIPIRWRVIDHYVGADDHTSLDGWLKRLLDTLHPEIADLTGPVPDSPKERQETLSSWLALAARRAEQRGAQPATPVRFALILDALDQLLDGGQDLGVLTPQVLGPDAVLVVSAADGTPAREAARPFETIEVPPLDDALRATLIRDTLKRFRKSLSPELAAQLAQAPQSGSPLFLSLALEDLRLNARRRTVEEMVKTMGDSPDAGHLFLHRFLLDPVYGRPEAPTLAVDFMALLGASRQGLTESELADLLALPLDPVSAETGKPRLPQAHLSRLMNAFQPFLLNKEGNRAPMHRLFGVTALGHAGVNEIRERLYADFQPGYGTEWDGVDGRGAAEALYQITQLAGLEGRDPLGSRDRLVRDLGCLRVPAHLYDAAAEVTAAALMALTETEKTDLSHRWQQAVEAFDLPALNQASADIRGLAGWMQGMAYNQYRLPRRLVEALLTVQERLMPVDDLEIPSTMNLLGRLCQDMADYPPVRALYERALAIREHILGPMHSDTATSLNDLAGYLEETGNPADRAAARPLYERALAIREQVLGPTHPDTAAHLNNLAYYLERTGDPADRVAARPFFERALSICEQSLGPTHSNTAKSFNNLANYLTKTGIPADQAAARPLFERALAISEQVLGPGHPDTASTLNSLAGYLIETGDPADWAAARPLLEQALMIRKQVLGSTHPATAQSLNNMAFYLTRTGDPADREKARSLYELALEITEFTLGPAHPDTASSLDNLAACLEETGDLADRSAARLLYERALAIDEQALGPTHPDTALSLNNLAIFLAASDDPADRAAARPLYERALAINEKAVGPEHPITATSLNNLARYLYETGDPDDFAAARPLYERALAIREEVLGPTHPDTATSLNNLAVYLDETGDPADRLAARPLYERALAIREEVLGPTHPDTALSLNNLAYYLNETGDPDDFAAARPLNERALAINEQALGPTHPHTARSLNNLAHYLERTGDPADLATSGSLYERAQTINSLTSLKEKTPMRLTETLQQWLRDQGWEEKPEIDEENKTSSTGFLYTVNDINLECHFEIAEKGQLFRLFMYCKNVKVPEKRLEEMNTFVCEYSKTFYLGQLQLLRDNRILRYYNAIDVEDAAFEPQHITNMLNAGVNLMGRTLPKYMAICFGGKSADEALAEE